MALVASAAALVLVGAACADDGSDAGAGTGSTGDTVAGATGDTEGSTGTADSTGSSGGGGGGRYDYGSGGAGDDDGQDDGGDQMDGEIAVTASGFAFAPTELEVAAGTEILVENADGVAHTFTIDGTDIDLELDPGDVEDAEIDLDTGSYGFHCRFHSSMTGTLTVI
jgi:plastocyanin